MDQLGAASIRYRIAIGPQSGQRTMTLHDPALIRPGLPDKPLTTHHNGFSLNAAVACKPHQRERLERLARYVCRPAICLERLSLRNDGQVQYALKRPFRDGTTHVLFSPADFISKLVALIPRPRHHLVRYHGVLAPNASIRSAIVPGKQRQKTQSDNDSPRDTDKAPQSPAPDTLIAPLSWAERLKRIFQIDVLACPRCGGTLRIIGDVTDPMIIRKILDHIAARAPPVSAAASTTNIERG